jgi:hypothetical protein
MGKVNKTSKETLSTEIPSKEALSSCESLSEICIFAGQKIKKGFVDNLMSKKWK